LPLVADPQHRLEEIRRQQNIDHETLARRLGISVEYLQRQEQGGGEVPLSVLHRWAEALGVPVTEMLVERHPAYTTGDFGPDQAARLLKTARQILERSPRREVCRLAGEFIEQLAEICPELKHQSPDNTLHDIRPLSELVFSSE
jgi:transcriptional regulator with XRE-family HTH domain